MESIWLSSPAVLEKMMGKHAPRSATDCHGAASVSTKLGTGPRTIPSTIPHRAARCSFSPRRKTSRSPAIPGHCSHGIFFCYPSRHREGMPSFSGFERDLEAETTVCIDGLFRKIMRGNYNRPAEVAVAIDCAKLLVCLRPVGSDPPPAYNIA